MQSVHHNSSDINLIGKKYASRYLLTFWADWHLFYWFRGQEGELGGGVILGRRSMFYSWLSEIGSGSEVASNKLVPTVLNQYGLRLLKSRFKNTSKNLWNHKDQPNSLYPDVPINNQFIHPCSLKACGRCRLASGRWGDLVGLLYGCTERHAVGCIPYTIVWQSMAFFFSQRSKEKEKMKNLRRQWKALPTLIKEQEPPWYLVP
jgi:hypothetical protein